MKAISSTFFDFDPPPSLENGGFGGLKSLKLIYASSLTTTTTTVDPRKLTIIEQEFTLGLMDAGELATLQADYFVYLGNPAVKPQAIIDFENNLSGVLGYVFQTTGDDQLEIETGDENVNIIALNGETLMIQMNIRHDPAESGNDLMTNLQNAYVSNDGNLILTAAELIWENSMKMCEGDSCLLFMSG